LESFQKRERERKKLQNRREKADRKRQRSEHGVPPASDAAPSDPESNDGAAREVRTDGPKPDPSTA